MLGLQTHLCLRFAQVLMWTQPLLLYINCLSSLSYLNSWVMLNWKIRDSFVWQRHFPDIIASWQWQEYSSLLSPRSTAREQSGGEGQGKRQVAAGRFQTRRAQRTNHLSLLETLLPAPAWTAGRLCRGQGPPTKTPICEHANSLKGESLN